MGARLSVNNHDTDASDRSEPLQFEACKRQKTYCHLGDDDTRLIPNLPDEISVQILARLPRISHSNAKLVSKRWRATLRSQELFNLRKELGTTEQWLYILTKHDVDRFTWYALDPLSKIWQRLPPMPNLALEEGHNNWALSALHIANVVRGWFVRKSSFDQIPFCGYGVGAVDGCLYVIGGFRRAEVLKSVWRYNPILNSWSELNPMSVGRAYCKTGVLNNKLYVVGGVTCDQHGVTPLRSGEVFNPCSGQWTEIPDMPFSKAQVLPTAFLTDLLKPIASGMIPYKGKLYVPQSLYCWPFVVDVCGEIYDSGSNSWNEMPSGMGKGWPGKQSGSKSSVIVDGELHALEPCHDSNNNPDSAMIKVYDQETDAWRTIEGDVPVICDVTDSESPYLLAAIYDKLHVVTKDANQNISVMIAEKRDRHGTTDSSTSSCSDNNNNNKNNIGESLLQDICESVSSLPWEYIWRVVATRNVGSTELVSCQVIDV